MQPLSALLLAFCVQAQPIISRVLIMDGNEEPLTMHFRDDFTFYARALCLKYSVSDCTHVIRDMVIGLPGREMVFSVPFTNMATFQIQRFNLSVIEREPIDGIAARWCRDMGHELIASCMQEWNVDKSDIPLVYVSGFAADDFNLGDISGFLIMQHFALQHHVHALKLLGQAGGGTPCVITVGSLLNWVSNLSPCAIIGTGLIADPRNRGRPFPYALDIRAVRGPITAAIADITGSTEYVSDLALLMPTVFPRVEFEAYRCNITTATERHCESLKDVGFIIHSADRAAFFSQYPHFRPFLVDSHQPLMTNFLLELFQYRRILSSSLHGVIFSHAYGIPAAAFKVGDDLIGGSFKFADYFRSVGCKTYTIRPTVEDIGPNFTLSDITAFIDKHWQPDPVEISRLQSRQEYLVHRYFEGLKEQYRYAPPLFVNPSHRLSG